LTALAGDKDLIVADILSHASIQSGIEMARGQSRYFKHNDINHLEKILSTERTKAAGCLIATEGAFSMDGDVAPIDQIIVKAKAHNCRVLVDEAHSFGILGPTGLGACEHYDAVKETDLIMGTFSKICGGIGGFIVGDEEVIDWLYFYSKPHMFSVSLPPSNIAAVLEALRIFKEDQDGLREMKENIRHFVSGLRSIGYPIDASHQTPIIPVVIGDEEKLGMVHQRMMDAGIYTIPVVYPAVSRNGCRFRFTIMRQHTISDLDYVLTVLESALKEAGVDLNNREDNITSKNEAA
jgi:7-keto-8-aminopelargonate synthetase-like enzyme